MFDPYWLHLVPLLALISLGITCSQTISIHSFAFSLPRILYLPTRTPSGIWLCTNFRAAFFFRFRIYKSRTNLHKLSVLSLHLFLLLRPPIYAFSGTYTPPLSGVPRTFMFLYSLLFFYLPLQFVHVDFSGAGLCIRCVSSTIYQLADGRKVCDAWESGDMR